MFSSLSHFLPAALHTSSPTKTELREDDDDDDDPGNKSDAHTDELGAPKKKKDKSANETFIFVRPPPAKSNHPLNLQVQLVPPNSRGPSGLTSASRQSLDLSAAPVTPAGSAPTTPVEATAPTTPVNSAPHDGPYEAGAPLTRTASNRSTASSTYSSNSTTSTSSTASSRRMIVPLYNLQAHNVMTNIIVDAGTDAKIARFTKRGIEMLDLAVLEPVEVYPGGGAPEHGGLPGTSGFSTRTIGARPSTSAMNTSGGGLMVPGANGGGGSSRPGTPDPTSSQASLTSSSAHSHHVHEPEQAPGTPSTPQGKRKLFGNLFKRKDAASPGPGADPHNQTLSPTPTPGHARTRSALGGRPASPTASLGLPRTSTSSAHRSSIDLGSGAGDETMVVPTVVGRQPILGLLASVSSPVHPPKGRPGLYVWVVKRWMKNEGGGLLSVAKGMVKGHAGEHDLTGEVEVRFEWKRGKAKRRREKESKEKAEGKAEAENGGSRNGSIRRRQASMGNLAPQKRLSIHAISRQSSFSTMGASEEGDLSARRRSLHHADEDSGDESDPEDSETPWTCTVKVRRLAAHQHSRAQSHHSRGQPAQAQEGQDAEQDERDRAQWKKEVVRIKVGTLSPTPHHPKVVAMLKVPFPLPDLDVERMVVHKRDAGRGSLNANSAPGMKPGHGLMITAEEIKDVVCSTGLWLVVREGFGGIGKVSRKGDGWRIRG
ncbi:hypothetical protein K438DRAFT_2017967 [Mycena galopus ATCC 62051]|nr:hypothetical protein K438DRAFT_2017967 [Mycena galopus ATCC 62051]